ncbi:hypothetical protein CDAR_280411 [Caerostris darwini]|uniref:Uncharacterized protein n=1 Tax=Caerostris darwini TaxID=1538125 RepID=A0AAV4VG94_9ARAC|nr:hypothetical protein CDAR_280411 [Caerostris darwini]
MRIFTNRVKNKILHESQQAQKLRAPKHEKDNPFLAMNRASTSCNGSNWLMRSVHCPLSWAGVIKIRPETWLSTYSGLFPARVYLKENDGVPQSDFDVLDYSCTLGMVVNKISTS